MAVIFIIVCFNGYNIFALPCRHCFGYGRVQAVECADHEQSIQARRSVCKHQLHLQWERCQFYFKPNYQVITHLEFFKSSRNESPVRRDTKPIGFIYFPSSSCHKNQSVYVTLKLNNLYDIDELKKEFERSNFEDQIRNFKSRFNVRTNDVVLLDPEAKVKLINLAKSPLNDIQFDKYAELVSLWSTSFAAVCSALKWYWFFLSAISSICRWPK